MCVSIDILGWYIENTIFSYCLAYKKHDAIKAANNDDPDLDKLLSALLLLSTSNPVTLPIPYKLCFLPPLSDLPQASHEPLLHDLPYLASLEPLLLELLLLELLLLELLLVTGCL